MLNLEILLAPVVAFMGLAFLLNAVMRRFRETRYEQIAFGLLFGLGLFSRYKNEIMQL